MRIDFPKEDIPEELVDFHYKSIMDFHMSYEKMRFDRDFSYIKYAGIFMLANLGMIFMDSVSAASNHNLWIMLFGIGLAFVLAMNMIFISAGIDAKCSLYLKEGISIEKKYQSLNNFHYFQASAEGRSAQYIASLFKRLLPFVVVGGMTIWAGISLSKMMNTNLVIMAGVGGTTLLVLMTFLLGRVIRRNQLHLSNEGF